MSTQSSHPDHSTDIKRLNRMIGQLEGLKKMIQDKRYCTEILTQTKAVSAALKGLEAAIIERHLNHCVSAALDSNNKSESQKKIDELIELWKKRI